MKLTQCKLLSGKQPERYPRYEIHYSYLITDLNNKQLAEIEVTHIQYSLWNTDKNSLDNYVVGTLKCNDIEQNFYGDEFYIIEAFLNKLGYAWNEKDKKERLGEELFDKYDYNPLT